MFGIGWWLYIDGAASSASNHATKVATGYSWIPGVFMTIVFFAINGMDWRELNMRDEPQTSTRARIFLIVSLVFQLAALCVSVYVMVDKFLDVEGANAWAGTSVFLSNMLMFLATYVMRFGTLPENEEGGGMFV